MQHWGLVHATADTHAARIYEMAGAHPARPPGPLWLIRQLGGEVRIYRGEGLARGDCIVRDAPDDGWRVELHAGLPLPDASLALARGIARWYCWKTGAIALDPPDDLASALLLPALALRVTAHGLGLSALEVAATFVVPQRIAEIRLRQVVCPPSRSGTYARVTEVAAATRR